MKINRLVGVHGTRMFTEVVLHFEDFERPHTVDPTRFRGIHIDEIKVPKEYFLDFYLAVYEDIPYPKPLKWLEYLIPSLRAGDYVKADIVEID